MNKEKLDIVFKECFPKAKDKDRQINAILEYAPRFYIETPERMAAFIAQVGHECSSFTVFRESLNYSIEGLLKTFSRTRISEQDCNRLGRAPGRPANQEAIANILYGGAFGLKNLGNTEEGDGWKFRGIGHKQITGRHNMTVIGKLMDIDLISNPELLLETENGIIAALHYWNSANPTGKSLNPIADAGNDSLLTKRINGGSLGLKQRTELRKKILAILKS